ncbi:MAG: site-specific integrase, partial [Defluviitaleaceae bacterium]|nr:site-specific integrase [Defluviitaleaceae bacterium]
MPVYKDEQRGTWFISCYYVDWDGKRRLKKKRGFERRKDAQSYEREFLLKQSKLPTITFGLLVDNYNEDMEHRLRGTTKAVKNYVVQKHFIPFFGNLPLDEITPIHIRKWQSQILVRGYSKTYTKLLNNQLVALFNYAVRFYQLPENPCHKAGTIGTKKADTMQFWTYNEFQLFLQHVTAPPAKLGFQLLFWTGIRIGELLALTATDFNFENQTLSITKNYQVVKGEPHIFEPKTQKSVRKIPLPQALMPVI